jgi:dTDP-4-dehydrorhamnose 3,5-epimerase
VIFIPLKLEGAYLIDLDKKEDERGFFARYYCENEFKSKGLETNWVQTNTTLTLKKGTIRGLHFQRDPMAEVKIVRCLRGSIWDVIVDLRKKSPTFGQWLNLELNESNRSMVYIPKGFAHGFQTLQDNCELLYMHSEFYSSSCEGGIRFNDPDLNINWPISSKFFSNRDENHPRLNQIDFL